MRKITLIGALAVASALGALMAAELIYIELLKWRANHGDPDAIELLVEMEVAWR